MSGIYTLGAAASGETTLNPLAWTGTSSILCVNGLVNLRRTNVPSTKTHESSLVVVGQQAAALQDVVPPGVLPTIPGLALILGRQ